MTRGSFLHVLIFVELAPRESPMRLLVADEVADVGVHLGEDERDVVAEADLSAPDGFNGRRAALVIVCEKCIDVLKYCWNGEVPFHEERSSYNEDTFSGKVPCSSEVKFLLNGT